jgi:hypothetical protein
MHSRKMATHVIPFILTLKKQFCSNQTVARHYIKFNIYYSISVQQSGFLLWICWMRNKECNPLLTLRLTLLAANPAKGQ